MKEMQNERIDTNRRTSMPRIIQWVVVLVLVISMGSHWAVLQTMAWASMLISYSRNTPFAEAVVKTFDGKHPCRMCLQIREGRQREERQQNNTPLIKIEKMPDLILVARQAMSPLALAEAGDAVPTVPHLHVDFIESPPAPPPRPFFAVL
jgi:hypothetical protein